MTIKPPLPKKSALPKENLINLQDHRYLSNMMELRTENKLRKKGTPFVEGRKLDYSQSFTQVKMSRYFTLESLFLLVCLTISLLILPLVLPPLPPPPFLLLLVPIFILGLLMILAFMPLNVRDATYTYA